MKLQSLSGVFYIWLVGMSASFSVFLGELLSKLFTRTDINNNVIRYADNFAD